MPRFRYIAYGADGRREDGHLEMATKDQAWARLVGLGLTVIKLAEEASPVERPWRMLAARSISLADQADFADQLALLFGAKLPVAEVIRIVEMTNAQPNLRRILRRTGQLVNEGQSLPDAVSAAGAGLSPLFSGIMRVGQSSGQLPAMMTSFAASLRRQEKLSSQIGAALVYPFILIVGGIIVFLLMTLFLAPRLEVIFTSANRPVPGELAFFIGLGRVLQTWGPLLALAVGATAFAGLFLVRLQSGALTRFAASAPIIGSLIGDMALVRLTASIGLLLRAGVPVVSALRQTATSFPKQLFSQDLEEAASTIEGGGKASAVFAQQRLLSPLFRELYLVGEATNTLPQVLGSVTASLEDRIERRLQKLLALLTPVLTLIIGGGIAFLVYSVMGAILSVNDLAF